MRRGTRKSALALVASFLLAAPLAARGDREIERVPGQGFIRVPFKSADASVTVEDNVEVFRRFDHGKLVVEYRGKAYRLFYPDGILQESGRYDGDDKRDGARQRFRGDKTLELEEHWSHGRLNGLCKLLNQDGSIHAEAEYKNGKLIRGRWTKPDGIIAYEGSDQRKFEDVFGERKGLEMADFRKLFNPAK